MDDTSQVKETTERREQTAVLAIPDYSILLFNGLPISNTNPSVGANVLHSPLFIDGNYNRSNKKIRVTVEEPAGKYLLFSRIEHDEKRLYFLTASGRIDNTAGYFQSEWDDKSYKRVDHRPTESELDEVIPKIAERFEKDMADPTKWAKYQHAAVLNLLDECDAHNAPVRKLRDEEDRRRKADAEQARKDEQRQKQEKLNARVDEIAEALQKGNNISVSYDEYKYDGKNPVLELFKLYDIALPLRTQGWVNTGLAELSESGYRYYSSKHKRNSTTFSEYLSKLREAIRQTPIEQMRDKKANSDTAKEDNNTVELQLYEKFTTLFPQFMSGEFQSLRLEAPHAKPLSLEWVFGDRISIAHNYELNGEPAYEPMVMLIVNSDNKTMTASSLELSEPPRNDVVYGENGRADTVMQQNINNFTSQWLDRAEKQGFKPVEATIEIDGEEVKISFGADGKPFIPERQPGYQEWSEPATADNMPEQPGIPSDDVNEYLPQTSNLTPDDNENLQSKGASMEYSELQHRGFKIAKQYENLPLQDRLNIIAQSFGVKSASVYIEPCSGKYRGQSDIMLKLESGGTIGIGMHSNAAARKDSTISECVNNALARYNPKTVAEAKVRARYALKAREAEDNINAEQRGLKPYKFLNVELSDGERDHGDTGKYYATLAVDNKVFGFITTDLASDIGRGKLTNSVSRANYFVAGGLRDSDVDFVFNNVGHSSFNGSYTVEMSEIARERAEKTLMELLQSQNLTPDDKEFWNAEIAAFLAANDGKMELADLELPPLDNYGGLGKFFQVFGEHDYKHEFANILAEENAKRAGVPWIVFNHCEGGAYRPDFLKTPTAMLFSEADAFIKVYEPKVREMHGGYDRLDYTIFCKLRDNEVWTSNDRYDIGDSKKVSGFYNVLKAETDFYYSHPDIYKWKSTDENFEAEKALAYADIEILKKAVTTEYPYVEIEKVVRYANGDRLDERVFNEGEILTVSEADSKIIREEKEMRDRYTKKYGKPGDGDEELSIAVHYKLPEYSEPSVFRFTYLLGDYDEERSGLLKHFEMGATYYNACVQNGNYGNVNATFGGKTADDAIRLASEYSKIYDALSTPSMPSSVIEADEKVSTVAEPKTKTEKMEYLDMSLPDSTVSIAEMNEYGYDYEEMLPLKQGRAVELFDTGHTIYLLHSDNTEAMAFDRDEIQYFDGLCGIERADWERSPVYAAQMAVAKNHAGSLESELLYGDGDCFGIYQVKGGEEMRDYLFEAHARLHERGLSVNRGNYELVYTMGISDLFSPLTDKNDFLHQVYETFNASHPKDFTGRSVSISDVIVVKYKGEISSHYVDSGEFSELPAFLGEETQKLKLAEIPAQTYSQVGNSLKAERADTSKTERASTPKPKLTLIERLEANKRKAAQQGQSGASNHNKNREV